MDDMLVNLPYIMISSMNRLIKLKFPFSGIVDTIVFVPGQLEEAFIYRLAVKMTTNYRGLGILLGVESCEIDAIERNNPKDVENVTFLIMKKWLEKSTESIGTTYDKLERALSEIGRNDLAKAVTVGK